MLEERLDMPPQQPTIPKTNYINVAPKLDDKQDHKMDMADEEYNACGKDGNDTYGYKDNIMDDL